MKQNVEAEGGELILRNAEGHIAIIPKHRRGEAEAYLEADDQHSLGGLINSLPRAEDYAEDGSLYIGTPPDGKDPEGNTNEKKKYTYDDQKDYKYEAGKAPSDYGFGDLNTLQSTVDEWETNPSGFKPSKGLENETYFRYVAPGNAPNFATHGCTGSSCRAQKQFNPDLPSSYDVLNRQGISSAFTKGEIESPGIDAWEIADQLEKNKKGKKLFAANLTQEGDADAGKKRNSYLKTFDYSKLPLNTLLSFGEARGEYVDSDANWKEGKENMPLPRHTGSIVKFDEETGDAFVYNPGYRNVTNKKGKVRQTKGTASIVRVGSSSEADSDWSTFAKEHNMVYATSINDAGDWTHSKLKQYKKEREEAKKAAEETTVIASKTSKL